MAATSNSTKNIHELSEILSDYAIDRTEVRFLLDCLPLDIEFNRTSIEYELQLLKILAVGWSINYYVQDDILKQKLSEIYWNSIQQFSENISTLSSVSMKQTFNYFQTIRERLDTYLSKFSNPAQSDDPVAVIGPIFAQLCGHPNEAMVMWVGCKMFQSILNKIKTYLSDARFVTDNSFSNIQSDNE